MTTFEAGEPPAIRILHLSDLHASETEDFGQRRVAAAFLEDLRRQQEEAPIDLVIFSGDLAFAGTSAEFELGYTLLLEPTLRCVGLDPTRLVLVAGNHDVHRRAINRFEDIGLRQGLADEERIRALLEEPDQLSSAVMRLSAWKTFVDELSDSTQVAQHGGLARTYSYELRGTTVGVAALNSAWRSADDEDERRLLIGEYQLISALDAIRACSVKLVVAHHPLEWLAHFDESAARRALETEHAVYLCGHEHSAAPSIEMRRGGGVVYSRAGCLYESTNYLNAYSLVTVVPDSGQVSVEVRSWWPERGEFDVATNVSKEGRFAFTFTQAAISRVSHPPFNVVRQALVDVAPAPTRLPENADQVPAVLDEMLVEPRFLPLRYEDALAAKRVDDDITVDPVQPWNPAWTEARVVVVAGDHGSGVTSAVLWLLDARYRRDATLFPLFIEHHARFSQRRIASTLTQAARAAGWTHELPPLVIGINDVTPSGRGLDQVLEYLRDNPMHQAVLGCHEDDFPAVASKLESANLRFEHAFIAPFGVRQVRALIDQIVGAPSEDVLRLIFALVHSQELPRTPFILAALVVVVATLRSADTSELNPSTLLQSYVNLLLGRDDLEDREHLAMDYRRREHLLASFAAELARRGAETMSRLDAEAYLGNWFRTKGWGPTSSPGQVLNSLIQRRILAQDGAGEVGFLQPALRHLFTAKWMLEEPEFRDQLLADPLKYADPISHAAALMRSSDQYLTVSVRALEAALADYDFALGERLFDELKGQEGWARVKPSTDQLKERLEQGDEPLPNQEERDEELEAYTESLEAQVVDEETASSPGRDILNALSLATWVLRSSELVDDVELKIDALRAAVKGWGLIAGIVATSELEEFTRTYVEEHRDQGSDEITEDELDRVARLMMVVRLIVTVEGQLGTVHLSGVVDRLVKDSEFMAESAQAMFTTVLYWHLHRSQGIARMRELYESHKEHPIVVSVVRAIAHWSYEREGDLRARQRWEDLLVDLYSDSEGLTGRERSLGRGRIAAQLRRLRLKQLARRSPDALDSLDDLDPPEHAEGDGGN